MAKLQFAGFENFAFIPDPAIESISETLEFLTDVVQTHDGSLRTTVGRSAARQSYRYSMGADLLRRQSLFNLGDQNIRGNWALPVWSEAQVVTGLSGTSVPCNTDISDFRAGNLVLAFFSADHWQVRQIASVGFTGITVTTAFDPMQTAVLVPVNKARVRGDIDYELRGLNSTFDALFDVEDPKRHITHLSVMFAFDVSGSMAGARIEAAKANLTATVLALKGAVQNSGVRVDFTLCFWNNTTANFTYINATPADFDAALAVIAARTAGGGTTPLGAFQRANQYFGTENPNTGNRRDVLFFTVDPSDANLTSSAAEAAAMIARAAPYDGARSVDIYAINIQSTNITEALKVDNASGGAITIVQDSDPDAMTDRFYSALAPTIGYQFDGYEILTQEPTTSGDSVGKGIQKIEDRVDFGGVVSVLSPWLQSRTMINHPFVLEGLEEVRSFKRFLYRRQGRARPFCLPTFQHDLHLRDLSNDRLSAQVPNSDMDAYNGDRRRFVVRYLDGTWQGNRITGVTPNLFGGYQLTFLRALRQPLERIAQVSFMGVAYQISDRIEINWRGDRAVEASLGIVEVQK
jgi:hypothetical protein